MEVRATSGVYAKGLSRYLGTLRYQYQKQHWQPGAFVAKASEVPRLYWQRRTRKVLTMASSYLGT